MCECSKQDLVSVKSLSDARERRVFGIISKGPTNFTAIKSKAGLHQEITSRLLKRLGGKAIVRKVNGLYELCCNGTQLKTIGMNDQLWAKLH